MIKKIDARGLPCPQPVVLTKKVIEKMEKGTVEVTVDSETSSENILRFATSIGCVASVKREKDNFIVRIEKMQTVFKKENWQDGMISVFIRSDSIGRGNDALGKILMRAFLPTLIETQPHPKRVIFMNAGVKLTVEGSEVIDSLIEIEKAGVKLLVCGTCLDFYGIKDRLKVGKVSNMFEIVNLLFNSDKVITI